MLIPSTDSDRPSILYVDDEPENLQSFKALFRRNYKIFLAETAQGAMRILRTEDICVLVTDQRMPEMTGTALLELAAAEFPGVLRYMLTGYSDYDPLVDAINRGKVHGYFSKPLNPSDFMERVGKGVEASLLKARNRRLLAELEDSQAKLRQAHQLAQIGIWGWDRATDRVTWSEELYRFTGLDPAQAPPPLAGLAAFFEAGSWASLEEAVDRTMSTGEPYKLELAMNCPDGVRWVSAFGGPTHDPQGAITGLHGTVQDITEEKRSKEELRLARDKANAANIAKNEFLANMSHEIRTPLNGIFSMLQLMGTTPLDGEQKEYVSVAVKSSKRLTRLLSDILDLSVIESGRMNIREAAFSLQDMRDSVLELFSVEARNKGVALEWSVAPPAPPCIIGDEGRLRQILFNLVGNAVKFTERGAVRVEISRLSVPAAQGCRLLFTVNDTGIGIAEDKLKIIFEPFVQVDGSYTRAFQGAGLGLSIVRKLVALMGGDLVLDSVLGRGTTVNFSLPFGLPGQEPETAQTTPVEQPQVDKPLRLLLVEDDEMNLSSGRNMLQLFGHVVSTARDGREALHLLARQGFDLVLMDIQMPEMDGVAATRAIRAASTLAVPPDIPLIAMTAYAMVGDREKFLEAGMDDYIAKPIDMEELERIIARVMDKRGQGLLQL